jgi:hypothetical protein
MYFPARREVGPARSRRPQTGGKGPPLDRSRAGRLSQAYVEGRAADHFTFVNFSLDFRGSAPHRQPLPRRYTPLVTAGPWVCPACARSFGRRGQSHECAPAISLDAYFAARPPFERSICEAVTAHLESLGPLVVEAVDVGILFKRRRTFAELRPKRSSIALSLLVSREISHPRIARVLRASRERRACFVDLRSSAEVDETVRGWLTEAYFSSPE